MGDHCIRAVARALGTLVMHHLPEAHIGVSRLDSLSSALSSCLRSGPHFARALGWQPSCQGAQGLFSEAQEMCSANTQTDIFP